MSIVTTITPRAEHVVASDEAGPLVEQTACCVVARFIAFGVWPVHVES